MSTVIDDTTYALWLRNPDASVVHLVALSYYGQSSVLTVKLTDRPYGPYRAIVQAIPSITRAISQQLSGYVSAGVGSVVLDNREGDLDTWLDMEWAGYDVTIYHGDPSWPEDQFRVVFAGINEGVSGATYDDLTFRLRPRDYEFAQSIQSTLVASGPAANRPVPILIGPCRNITPVVVDAATSTYQYHDAAGWGAAQAVTDLRVGGVSYQTSPIAISAVDAGTDTLSTATTHGFVEGTRVRYTTGTPPAPLALDTDYWVIAAGLTTTDYRLSATSGGSAIDITGTDTGAVAVGYQWTADLSAGTVTASLAVDGELTVDAEGAVGSSYTHDAVTIAAVDADTDIITTSAAHGFTGMYTRFRLTAGTPPAPLALDTDYWAVALSDTTLLVYDAYAGSQIDITGTDTGATLVGYHLSTNAADVLQLVLGATAVDAASMADFADLIPYTVGVYITDRASRLQVADRLMGGLYSWYGHDRSGNLVAGRIFNDTADPVVEVWMEPDDLDGAGIQFDGWTPEYCGQRYIYQKNWTVQSSLLPAVSEADRGYYSGPGLVSTLGEGDLCVGGPLKVQFPEPVETYLYEADTDGYTGRKPSLLALFSATFGRAGLLLDIGTVFAIRDARWEPAFADGGYDPGTGIDYGQYLVGTVYEIEDNHTDGRVRVRFAVLNASLRAQGQL